MNDWKLLLDDLAAMAAGAAGLAQNMQREAQHKFSRRMEKIAAKMDFVPRSEFEAIQAMLKKARLEQEDIKKRLQRLESKAPKAKAAKTKKK